MRHLDIIPNVGNFISSKEDCYYLKKNKLFKNKEAIILLEEKFFGTFYIFDDTIIIQRYRGQASIYRNEHIEKDNIEGYYNYLNQLAITFLNKKENFSFEYVGEVFNKLPLKYNGYNIDKKYFTISGILTLWNYETGNELWHFDLSELGTWHLDYETEERKKEVGQFIGVYNNVLWVYVYGYEIIGLEVESGKLLYRFSSLAQENLTGKTFFSPIDDGGYRLYECRYILDETRGKIFGLIADLLYEIDLNSDTIVPAAHGLKDEFARNGINEQDIGKHGTVLQGNTLYFYNYNQLLFATLDIEAKEITYVSEKIVPAQAKGLMQIKDLQVSADKVYVLLSNGDLFIYDKEETGA
jgi:hypothetical protein